MARLTLDDYADADDPSDGPVELTDPSHLVGVPDEFQRLWTPHRMVYIEQGQQRPHGDDCPL